MYELKEIGKVFTSKSVGTGPSSYEKRIYRAAVSQRLRDIELNEHGFERSTGLYSSPLRMGITGEPTAPSHAKPKT